MSFKILLPVMMGAALALQGCTQSSTPPIVVQNPGQQGAGDLSPAAGQANQTGSNTGEAAVTLEQRDLQKYAINTSNLHYKFQYLTAKQDGDIKFDTSGKAQLIFRNLPSEQSGTVQLDILDGTTVKLTGSATNVTLAKGKNTDLSLTLHAAGSTGNSTDLTIDVALDNSGGGTTTTPPPGGTTTTPPPGGTTTTPPPGGTATTTPPTGGTATTTPPPGGTATTTTTDPVAGWDGKSFRGNAKWNIVPIKG